jgi:tetratricopeptide (TPR) repeat protein
MNDKFFIKSGSRAAASHPSGTARQLFSACCDALRRGDSAANRMLPKLERFPECVDGWIELGSTLLTLDQWAAADAAFDVVLRSTPSRSAASGKAEALIRLDQPQAAVGVIENHVADWSRDAAIAHRLGRARYASGDLAGAEEALAISTTLSPTSAEAWFRLGLTRQDRHDWQGAITAYDAACAARPSMFEAALNLGICQQEVGELDAAMSSYATAVDLEPSCFNRVAQALTSASTGRLWLDPGALRRELAALA